MSGASNDKVFAGAIPEIYEKFLVPLIFASYAEDMARRVALRGGKEILEIAAGTGVVTRALAGALPPDSRITATDLNAPMLEQAQKSGTVRPVEWKQADAMKLPFADAMFDAVVCQFGAMFFPDRSVAYSEARRVLKPGGTFVFNVWDRIEDNEFADVATAALATMFPGDAPQFMRRTPHGYHDTNAIRADLEKGGFSAIAEIETLSARSRADSARSVAIAYCQGTPLRNEIIARDESRLGEATEVVTRALANRFGDGAVDGKIQAHVVEISR
jgi:ubiquinone/menaquinone biosynthesis C-methylase UbiE